MFTKLYPLALFVTWVALPPLAARGQQGDTKQLAGQVRDVFQTYCFRCHGQNGAAEGGLGNLLELKDLIPARVVPGDVEKSRLFKRMGTKRDMPPEGEKMPSDAEIALVRKWIEAGAPAAAPEVVQNRPFRSLQDDLRAMVSYLRKQPQTNRTSIRFFTLTHLYNTPINRVRDADLRIYRAAISKMVNSLSRKREIVLPELIDPAGTVLAIDIRKLDWDRKQLWLEILKLYPYGLTHNNYPNDPETRELAEQLTELSGSDLPAVRADWFIATAFRPPLYHTLLQIPTNAKDLEKELNVDIPQNFLRGQVVRAGFTASGVSSQNRLLERHESTHGSYWKSYDFKTSSGQGNLYVFPLGPDFKQNPFPKLSFKHDGGEIIFSLPNGLSGYMLVNNKDERIDAGPVEIVSDSKKISGTPLIVNGLSCVTCHQHGVVPFKDTMREGVIVSGQAREKVLELHVPQAEMDRYFKKDEERYLRALEEAMGVYLKVGEDNNRAIADFPEPISAIAKWYLQQELTVEDAARELGLDDIKALTQAVENNGRLQEIGLFPLSRKGTIKRDTWEFLEFFTSPFQEAARELKRGTPKRYQ